MAPDLHHPIESYFNSAHMFHCAFSSVSGGGGGDDLSAYGMMHGVVP
jgi:hypothetical protein